MNDAAIKDTIEKLLTLLGFPATAVAVQKLQDMVRVDIDVPEPSRLIGWHGETLNAIQHLAKSMLRSADATDRGPFIVLDVDGYRKMQEEKVAQITERKAEVVRKTGSRMALSPMSPYFRRIVHLHVANSPHLSDLTTESIGEGEFRQVVLKLKNQSAQGSEELSPVIAGADDGLENLDV
jgi:spoIIIJ-associated protein